MVGRQVQLFQVEVVNEDSSLARIIESHEKIGEGAFPCSGVTNHRCHSTRAELDAQISHHLESEDDYSTFNMIPKSWPDGQALMDMWRSHF